MGFIGRRGSRRTAAIALGVVLSGGCSSIQKSPTPPSPAIDLTGTWRGAFTVQGTGAEMVWTLTQSGSAVNGPVLVRLPNGIVLLNGFLTGTLSDTTLTYVIAIGPQGIPSQPACTGQLGGTMAVQAGAISTLRGTYAVTSTTCPLPFDSSGNLSLTR